MPTNIYYQIGDNLGIYLCSIVILEGLVIYAWRFREMPGGKTLVFMQACKGLWLLLLVLASISTEFSDKLFCINLQKMLSLFIPYLWYIFILEASQQEKKMPSVVKPCLLASVGCLWLFMIFNWQGLMWRDVWLEGQSVMGIRGPVNWVALAYGYVLCILNMVLYIRWVFITAGLRRRQALWFTLAALISIAGHILWSIPDKRFLVALPLSFLISSVIITWLYYRWRYDSIMPLAQNVAARNMIEGMLVIDEQDYIVGINPAAQAMLAGLPTTVGGKLHAVTAVWPCLGEAINKLGVMTAEVLREHPEGNCYYQLHKIPLQTARGYILGSIILFKDITQQKHDQAKMVEQQKSLSILAERERLGRELHDAQGQFPGYVKTQTEAIKLLLKKGWLPEAMEQLMSLSKAADASFQDVRESITGLNIAARDWEFFEKFQSWLLQFGNMSEISIQYNGPKVRPPRWILPEAEVQLFRIIQETLVNTRKHSAASSVKVDFSFTADCLVVVIEDDGCGFETEKIQDKLISFGINIIKERAADIGGHCEVQSVTNQGTTVMIEIPLLK